MNKQDLQKQQGHPNTQISRKSHNDAFAASPNNVLVFLFLSVLDHFGRWPCDVYGRYLVFDMIARKGCGRFWRLWDGLSRILPDGFFQFDRAFYRFRQCLGEWGNRVFFRKRVMLRKLTKLVQLYLLIETRWPIFRIVIPEGTRCLHKKSINATSQMHKPCLQVLSVDILVTSVSGCHLLARIDHPTPSCAPRQGGPPEGKAVVSTNGILIPVATCLIPVARLLHGLRPRWYSVHYIALWRRIGCDRTPRVFPLRR